MAFYVTIAEFATGIIIDREGNWIISSADHRLVFDAESDACQFAEEHRTNNPEHECIVSDEKGAELHVFRPALVSTVPRRKKRIWWKFWAA